MAEIKSLKVLPKTSATGKDVLLVTNTNSNSARQYSLSNLFPSVNTVGTNSESIFVNVTNKNQINLKGLQSGSGGLLSIKSVRNNVIFKFKPSGLDLSQCDNSRSGFIRGINFNRAITGTLTPFYGGTGMSNVQKGSVLVATTENKYASASMVNNGQLLIGNSTSGYPTVGTLKGGANVRVTNSAGSITIAANLNRLIQHLKCDVYNLDLDIVTGRSWLSGDGTSEGVSVDADGKVFIGDSTPTVPTIDGQLHLCGSSTNAIVIGNTNNYSNHTIKAMTAAAGVAGLDLSILGANALSGNVKGGDITIQSGASTGSGVGGDLLLYAGDHAGSSTGGAVKLYTHDSSGDPIQALTIANTQDVTINAGNLFISSKPLYLRSNTTPRVIQYQGDEAVLDDGTTAISAANILIGICKCTPTADRSKATDTASNLISGLSLTATGDSVDFSVLNLATDGTSDITITAGTSVTLVGNMKIKSQDDADDAGYAGVGRFRVRRTGGSSVTMYRIA